MLTLPRFSRACAALCAPLALLLGAAGAPTAKAQNLLTTNAKYSYQGLVDSVLLGPGVHAFNVTFSGDTGQIGLFYGDAPGLNATTLGMDSGIVLTTGNIWGGGGARGPSTCGASQGSYGSSLDDDLDDLTTYTLHDVAFIEFDFIPSGDSIKFNFIFGSEEYPQYVNSSFSDVFGFFLEGVTVPMPKHNIALVPGTTTPISINSVNDGNASCSGSAFPALPGPCENCAYYVDARGQQLFQYDGHTTKITASEAVICGEIYHIKIAVADVGDQAFDSGVFLEALSFGSPTPAFSLDTTASTGKLNDSTYAEGGSVTLNFYRTSNLAQADTLLVAAAGTATNGTDYTGAPTALVFGVGQTQATFTVNLTLDALADNGEWFALAVATNSACTPIVSTDTFYIGSTALGLLDPAQAAVSLWVPNAFTPNGDGDNDLWRPQGAGITNYHAEVWNRLGQRVWQSNNPAIGWDGTCNNHPCTPGTYHYRIQVQDILGGKANPTGIINLIR